MAFPKIDGYVVTEKLGSGSYSTVYKAYTKVGARSVVAIKCVDKSRVKHSSTAVDNLLTEIRLLKTLSHPHIVQMKEFNWDDKNIYIITEYCCGGDLSRYIQRYGRVPERQVLYFLQQLASALKFLREKGVVHMDLKPHNLLLHKGSDGKYTLKVADFGFAQYIEGAGGGGGAGVRGSPLYMAPEMLLTNNYDARVDLWSVGVIMYECLFGRAPYSSTTFRELMDKIRNKAPILIPPTSSISPECRDLLTSLLRHEPTDRISYEHFFAHPYLDLEHMPCKENYDKAVSLLKQATELDSSGRLSEALSAYTEGLRCLVPELARYSGSAEARAALRDKVTRYMCRAEELKLLLKQNPAPASLPAPPPPRAPPPRAAPPHRPAGRGRGGSCEEYAVRDDAATTYCGSITPHSVCDNTDTSQGQNCDNGTDTCHNDVTMCRDEQRNSEKDSPPSSSAAGSAESRRRFSRWFKRKPDNEAPYTVSDIKEETEPKDKQPVGEAPNDMCKIT